MKINFVSLNNFIKNIQNSDNALSNIKAESKEANTAKADSQNASNQNNRISSGNVQFSGLNPAQQAIFIRELLSLPKEFKEFLSLLMFNEITNESLLKLMNEQNKGLQLKDIQNLLNDNSKEVFNKLLKLFQSSSGNFQNTDQLNKIINLLAQVVPNQNSAPQEVLTKAILLYLPWLPLIQQQEIVVNFEERKEGEDEKENVALIMYISTVNLGGFKVIITSNKDNSLSIEIESEEREQNKSCLEQILNSVNQEITDNKINGKINLYTQKVRTEKEFQKRELSIHPVSDISPKVMIAAYSVARIIFEYDEKMSLAQNRRQMIQ